MATTELLPTADAAANSADITVAAGTPVTLFLKNGGASTVMDNRARTDIQVKGAAANYYKIGELNGDKPIIVIDAPGVYRVVKYAGVTFGVDQA